MRKRWVTLLSILLLAAGYVSYTLVRNVNVNAPKIAMTTSISPKELSSTKLNIPRSAIGYIDPSTDQIKCRNVGEAKYDDQPIATASIAKTITVQVVLDKHPLAKDTSGPVITLGNQDVANYQKAVIEGGSRLQVVAGEQLTERQMIEGIIMRSANNLADSLATWAFGSHENYKAAATKWLKSHQLNHTTIGSDASGFSPDATSTPTDLCKIMLLATQNKNLSDILSTAEADLPVVGHIKSTNRLLGQYGVFAGKTGYNNEAGRGVILARKLDINGESITAAIASLSRDSYDSAFQTATELLQALPNDIQLYKIQRGKEVGIVTSKWGNSSRLITNRSAIVPYFVDQPPVFKLKLLDQPRSSIAAQSIIGNLTVDNQAIDITAKTDVSAPRLGWRLSHPF